jgi:hypothetical protein
MNALVDEVVQLLEAALGVLKTRDGLDVAPEHIRERARNATVALLGSFELRARREGRAEVTRISDVRVTRIDAAVGEQWRLLVEGVREEDRPAKQTSKKGGR